MKTVDGLHAGATASERESLTIQTAADLIIEEPQYSRLAARLLSASIDAELCTEILEVTSAGETAVCNLGSINLARHTTVVDGKTVFDHEKLANTVKTVIRQLDRVIDLNLYPIASAATSNERWRPIGLGLMGLQDVFFQLGLPFDHPDAAALSRTISENIYFHAIDTSVDLAAAHGAHPTFSETRAARGELQFDAWSVTPTDDRCHQPAHTPHAGGAPLVHRLVAFFATGDSIVANNLVLNLYKHINAPEARMYLSRQLYEEALHGEVDLNADF